MTPPRTSSITVSGRTRKVRAATGSDIQTGARLRGPSGGDTFEMSRCIRDLLQFGAEPPLGAFFFTTTQATL
jgi:hypothetical protein